MRAAVRASLHEEHVLDLLAAAAVAHLDRPALVAAALCACKELLLQFGSPCAPAACSQLLRCTLDMPLWLHHR